MSLDLLPLELVIGIANHLPLRDHARLLCVSRRYEPSLSRALYSRLISFQLTKDLPAERRKRAQNAKITRQQVVGWACERGSVSTLRKVDEAESLKPCLQSLEYSVRRPVVKRRVEDDEFPLYPLHLASLHGRHEMVRFLLDRGAEVNASIEDGPLPIDLAKNALVVNILLQQGSHHGTSEDAHVPLINSIRWGADASACRAFLALGADPSHVDQEGRSAILAAVEQCKVEIVTLLLEAGALLSHTWDEGATLLGFAVWSARDLLDTDIPCRLVRLLLDNGADPNSDYEPTAILQYLGPAGPISCLYLAALMDGGSDVFSLLLQSGADCHKRHPINGLLFLSRDTDDDFDNWYRFQDFHIANGIIAALVMFILHPHKWEMDGLVPRDWIRKFEMAVEYGADIELPCGDISPLNYCLSQYELTLPRALDIIPFLITSGADVNATDGRGLSPLHKLAGSVYERLQKTQRGNFLNRHGLRCKDPSAFADLLNLLMDHGADPNAIDEQGRTTLMHLCHIDHRFEASPMIRAVLRRPIIGVNRADQWGLTPLHYVFLVGTGVAYPYSDETCLRLQMLLHHSQNGIEVNHYNSRGRTPLHLLLEAVDMPLGLKGGPKTLAERRARIQAKHRALVMLLRAGADTTSRVIPRQGKEGDGDTALHIAAKSQEPTEMMEILLRYGAGVHVNATSGPCGLTPLMIVVESGARRREDGELLPRWSMARAIRVLLDAGADILARNDNGCTAWKRGMGLSELVPPWIFSAWLEEIEPEMSTEEKQKALKLGTGQWPFVKSSGKK